MKNINYVYLIYWIIVIVGFLSFLMPWIEEYGIIHTILFTFICGLFSWAFAMMIGKRSLIYISVLLLLSPYLFLFSISIF
ncbi:hypothetical protein [Halobacillus litoralis]|uniref:hypothetical protein n=1 Tax=Halobacillus litoralis TaxID=45668 RepID=UPI001CFE29B7|nr:hypothetical protein [Halobacillus litoralis]